MARSRKIPAFKVGSGGGSRQFAECVAGAWIKLKCNQPRALTGQDDFLEIQAATISARYPAQGCAGRQSMVLGVPLPGSHNRKRKSMFLGTDRFPTQVAVERHLEAFVLKLNSENPTQAISGADLQRLAGSFRRGREAA